MPKKARKTTKGAKTRASKRTPVRAKPPRSVKPRKQRNPLQEFDALITKKTAEGDVEIKCLPLSGEVSSKVQWWPSSLLEVDRLVKGLPGGRVIEIFGPEHIGKSTVADHFIKATQDQGGYGVLIDTETARDENYSASGIGLDPQKMRVFEFKPLEMSVENIINKVFDTIAFWREGWPDVPVCLVWDALGSTATNEELRKRVGEDVTAAAAKAMRRACRQIAARLGGSRIVFVIVNHEYEKISFGGGPGVKRDTYGGKGLKLLASMRIRMHHVQGGVLKAADGTIIGKVVGLDVEKNKLGNANMTGRLAILHGRGVSNTWSMYDHLKNMGYVGINSSWNEINLGGQVLKFQGWNGLQAKLDEDPTIWAQLEHAYKLATGGGG